KDNIRHGHGVQSVRKVVEKYNGTVSFTDKGIYLRFQQCSMELK
ncbi:hypothetical protein ROSINTL182_09286, partial [Roseburia intestinalis L1-82]